MDEVLLRLLADGEYRSGEAMSRALGVTRAAVWKRMEALRAQGFQIESGGRRGYRLILPEDGLRPPFLSVPGCSLRYEESLPSTNAAAAEMARAGAPHGTLVVAGEQTQGRGRRGRGWSSPPGTGAWFSLIVRPPIAPAQAQGVALLTALAASEACEAACGLRPGIKWPNDLVLGDRKCCGILLEMAAEAERVNWVVLGVGVNVRQAEADFPPELRERAVSLSMAAGKPVSRASVIQGFVQALWARWDAFVQAGIPSFMEDYAARSVTLGRTVRVEQAAESFVGVAEALGAQGELLVRTQPGELRPVWAGDVSVRGLMGYV